MELSKVWDSVGSIRGFDARSLGVATTTPHRRRSGSVLSRSQFALAITAVAAVVALNTPALGAAGQSAGRTAPTLRGVSIVEPRASTGDAAPARREHHDDRERHVSTNAPRGLGPPVLRSPTLIYELAGVRMSGAVQALARHGRPSIDSHALRVPA